jgi:hypothetical protein
MVQADFGPPAAVAVRRCTETDPGEAGLGEASAVFVDKIIEHGGPERADPFGPTASPRGENALAACVDSCTVNGQVKW